MVAAMAGAAKGAAQPKSTAKQITIRDSIDHQTPTPRQVGAP